MTEKKPKTRSEVLADLKADKRVICKHLSESVGLAVAIEENKDCAFMVISNGHDTLCMGQPFKYTPDPAPKSKFITDEPPPEEVPVEGVNYDGVRRNFLSRGFFEHGYLNVCSVDKKTFLIRTYKSLTTPHRSADWED